MARSLQAHAKCRTGGAYKCPGILPGHWPPAPVKSSLMLAPFSVPPRQLLTSNSRPIRGQHSATPASRPNPEYFAQGRQRELKAAGLHGATARLRALLLKKACKASERPSRGCAWRMLASPDAHSRPRSAVIDQVTGNGRPPE